MTLKELKEYIENNKQIFGELPDDIDATNPSDLRKWIRKKLKPKLKPKLKKKITIKSKKEVYCNTKTKQYNNNELYECPDDKVCDIDSNLCIDETDLPNDVKVVQYKNFKIIGSTDALKALGIEDKSEDLPDEDLESTELTKIQKQILKCLGLPK